jgi:hypothetical protein
MVPTYQFIVGQWKATGIVAGYVGTMTGGVGANLGNSREELDGKACTIEIVAQCAAMRHNNAAQHHATNVCSCAAQQLPTKFHGLHSQQAQHCFVIAGSGILRLFHSHEATW